MTLKRFGMLVSLVAERHGAKVDRGVYERARILRAPCSTNFKHGQQRPIRHWLGTGGPLSLERLEEVFEEYGIGLPEDTLAGGSLDIDASHVTEALGNAFARTVIDGELQWMRDVLAKAPVGATVDYQSGASKFESVGWEKGVANVARRITGVIKAPWNDYTAEQVLPLFAAAAPTDPGWTLHKSLAKWNRELSVSPVAYPPKGGEGGPSKLVPTSASPSQQPPFQDGYEDVKVTMTNAQGVESVDVIRTYQWNDFGMADRFVDQHGHQVRYAPTAAVWLFYDPKVGAWVEQNSTNPVKIRKLARQSIEDMARERYAYSDEKFKDENGLLTSTAIAFAQFQARKRSNSTVAAIVTGATTDDRIAAELSDFDLQENLLNCSNGVVDLRTGDLLAHDPELMLRRIAPVTYDPQAPAPRWTAFLERALPDPEIRDYIQRVVGYSLTASNREQQFWIHLGPGGTGKSLFVDLLNKLLGKQYGQTMPSSTLLAKRDEGGGIPSDVARMSGARFLQATETSPGKHLDDELIKRLTGGEEVSARELYGTWKDFAPTGKIHIATNYEPVLSSGGKSMRRRLRLVQWTVEIPEEEQDKELKTRILAEEAPGVLAWAVRGAIEWYAHGLRTPRSVVEASARLVANADPLQGWIDERVIKSLEPVEQVQVLEDYENWCTRNRVKHPMSGRAFGAAMEERGFTRFQHAVTRRQMFQLELRKGVAPVGRDSLSLVRGGAYSD